LDWVRVRSKCSLLEVFKKLRLDVEEDVRVFNEVRQFTASNSIRVIASTPGTIFIVCGSVAAIREVVFTLRNERIEIDDQASEKKFAVTLTLNKEGRCMFRYEGEELEQWQLRRMALETLFFTFLQ